MAGAGHSFRATWVRQLSQRTSLPEQMSQPELTVVSQAICTVVEEGYNHHFVDDVDTKYECPICLMVLRDPVQTGCGHRFCAGCLKKWQLESCQSSCPVCKVDFDKKTPFFPDNFAKREVLSLFVYCTHADKGCEEKIELQNLKTHLDNCGYSEMVCDKCRAVFCRQDQIMHNQEMCPHRLEMCIHCGKQIIYNILEEHHQTECDGILLNCTHCHSNVIKKQMSSHLANDCQAVPVACGFADLGCENKVQRDKLPAHNKDALQRHVELLRDALLPASAVSSYRTSDAEVVPVSPRRTQSLYIPSELFQNFSNEQLLTKLQTLSDDNYRQEQQIDDQRRQLSQMRLEKTILEQSLDDIRSHCQQLEDKLFCNGVYIWKVENYAAKRREAQNGGNAVLHSRGFYTSPYGYKLCVRLNLNGVDVGTGTHLSLFVHFMRGDYDSLLEWPFRGSISLSIMDQSTIPTMPKQHITETLVANQSLVAFQRPTTYRNLKGFGYVQFSQLSDLDSHDNIYIREDTVVIKAEVKEITQAWK